MARFSLIRWFGDLTIRYKLRLAIFGTSALALLIAASAIVPFQWVTARDSLQHDLKTLAEVMAANSTAAISFGDRRAAAEILAALRVRPNVLQACLYARESDALELMASYPPVATASLCSAQLSASNALTAKHVRGSAPVLFDRENLGELIIVESNAALVKALQADLLTMGGVLVVCLLVAFFLSTLLQRLIAMPLIELADTAARISNSNDYSLRAPKYWHDEVGALIDTFNTMLGQVESAERDLREVNSNLEVQIQERSRTNATLQQTLGQLQETQAQLVQTEKMASLGGLVAGIAHEINTPVGVCVTAASTLSSRSDELKQAFENNALTASGLKRFIEVAGQSTDIIMSNLHRAASLIQSFKQVAVDQSNADHRRFNVADYINEILLSLRPKLKNTHIDVQVDCDPELSIDSFPGVFAQILTNLVMNSVVHAFEPDSTGRIQITVRPTATGLSLVYADDGSGIRPEVLPKVFDPFFTTRRGMGGSGLGLHIVYNLITQQLGGSIHAVSTPGEGTEFQIEIKSIEHAQPESYSRVS